ncbi:hypothetical protein CFC21_100071 [Triticum aestivum]|uniref:E2 ubiquitin-conjugating enzyme n=3 Tax=Triticum TaxID=4564 RepID=A0A9R1BTJ4_TRITD|nr:hypothetical protein CFC21_100071 [Triticum aestivum]VAI80534.1 unnamed protein product [Triticum turgidum subsp. durum]
MATNENLPPNVIRQLAKELKNLDESPPEGIKVIVNDDDFSTIFADIEGPAGTPYENGVFRMKLLLSRDFPHSPPKGFFSTKIFHPNIATSGEICVNTLKKDWNPSLGLRHVLLVVRCLLIEPFPESALNEQAGKMLLENYEEYARLARSTFDYAFFNPSAMLADLFLTEQFWHMVMNLMAAISVRSDRRLYTGIHAHKHKNKSKSGAICESTTTLNVGQSNNTVPSKNIPSAPALVSTSTSTKVLGIQDQNAAPSDPAVGPSTANKKDGPLATKIPAEKRKMDARKKSLKRL